MASFQGLEYATPLTINSRGRVFRSETLNLKVQTNQNASQRWDLNVTLEPTTENATIAPLSIHRNFHGLHLGFLMEMPQYPGVELNISGDNIRLQNIHTAGDSALVMLNNNLTTAVIPAGLFFTLGSTKVYQVREEAILPTGDNIQVSIFPPLVADEADQVQMNASPNISVKYAPDGVEGVTFTDGILVNTIINVIEELG